MKEPKTRPTGASVEKFLNQVSDETKRADCFQIAKIMQDITGEEAKMWGPSMVGFGSWVYKYAGGQQLEWPVTAFAPRKQNLTIYLMWGFAEHADLMKKLGKHKAAGSCLHIKRMSDIHVPTFKKLIRDSVKQIKKRAKMKPS